MEGGRERGWVMERISTQSAKKIEHGVTDSSSISTTLEDLAIA